MARRRIEKCIRPKLGSASGYRMQINAGTSIIAAKQKRGAWIGQKQG